MRKLFWSLMLLTPIVLVWKTVQALLPPPLSLSVADSQIHRVQILDRDAQPLTVTYQNQWNIHDHLPLYQIPEILQKIFILSEDQHFLDHRGIDWGARGHAFLQNIQARRVVRGASTLTEQVIKMLHPRSRTLWTRWLEGLEASQWEKRFSKADILEFYLNQVPYAHQRRGVVQAARYYFDRSLETLSLKEMMALAVMVRAPSRLDLRKNTLELPIQRLAQRLIETQVISQQDYQEILTTPLELHPFELPVKASHFVYFIYTLPFAKKKSEYLQTTLDSGIQKTVQEILDKRLRDLHKKGVKHGAVLVVDHTRHEVLAWVNGSSSERSDHQIDAVTTPRQPGSTLKPFLYAMALESGWHAATLIEDAPLLTPVGTGLHNYRNYSRHYYGLLRLRDALGNSLNTPAIRTIQFVGVDNFLEKLHQLGMNSLTASANYYGEGLALGNGGVTLFELVQAYSTLAHQGSFVPLKVLKDTEWSPPSVKVFSQETSSLIADILSDPDARSLEFGRGSLLHFPVQTAVKTGTSTDYRDAWAIGFNHHYTVGVWLGNLDQKSMSSVSGSSGAALILRSIFSELTRYEETKNLYLSPQLVKIEICRTTGQRVMAPSDCPTRHEWFVPGIEPSSSPLPVQTPPLFHLKQPTEGLQLAMDPRIPDDHEAFALVLADSSLANTFPIQWWVDGQRLATTPAQVHQFLWPVKRGMHIAQARATDSKEFFITPEVKFYVK